MCIPHPSLILKELFYLQYSLVGQESRENFQLILVQFTFFSVQDQETVPVPFRWISSLPILATSFVNIGSIFQRKTQSSDQMCVLAELSTTTEEPQHQAETEDLNTDEDKKRQMINQ